MPRGRPPRAGQAATERVEVRVTLDELRGLKRLAEANHTTLAELLRTAACDAAADCGEPAPVTRGIVAGRKSGAGRP